MGSFGLGPYVVPRVQVRTLFVKVAPSHSIGQVLKLVPPLLMGTMETSQWCHLLSYDFKPLPPQKCKVEACPWGHCMSQHEGLIIHHCGMSG